MPTLWPPSKTTLSLVCLILSICEYSTVLLCKCLCSPNILFEKNELKHNVKTFNYIYLCVCDLKKWWTDSLKVTRLKQSAKTHSGVCELWLICKSDLLLLTKQIFFPQMCHMSRKQMMLQLKRRKKKGQNRQNSRVLLSLCIYFSSLANNKMRFLPRDLFSELDSLLELWVSNCGVCSVRLCLWGWVCWVWVKACTSFYPQCICSFMSSLLPCHDSSPMTLSVTFQRSARELVPVQLWEQMADDVAEKHKRHSVGCLLRRPHRHEGQAAQWPPYSTGRMYFHR